MMAARAASIPRTLKISRVDHGLVKRCLDFTDNPVKRLAGEMVFLKNITRGQCRTDMHPEKQGRVGLPFTTDCIVATNDDETLAKLFDSINNVGGVTITGLP